MARQDLAIGAAHHRPTFLFIFTFYFMGQYFKAINLDAKVAAYKLHKPGKTPAEMEFEIIQEAVATHGTQDAAAAHLEIARSTLRRALQKGTTKS